MTTTSVTTSTTSQYTITSGNELLVAAGGNVTGANIHSGGQLVISGGIDSNAVVSSGATETISTGSASGDQIYGVLSTVSGDVSHLTNEVVENGGTLFEVNSAVLTGTEVLSGGTLSINGNTSAANTVLSGGGIVDLTSPKATLTGTLTFAGGSNTLEANTITTTGGDQAVISGFASTDKIDATSVGAHATLSFVVSGGNEVATVSGTGGSESFVFSGTATYNSGTLSAVTDSAGSGVDIEYSASGFSSGVTTSVTTSTASGTYTETSGNTLLVANGGSISAAIVDNGGILVVSGGTDTAAVISSGGTETISAGTATGDQIYGSATVDGGTVTNEAVQSGGQLTVASGAVASSTTISAHGTETVLGSASSDAIYGTLATVASTSGILTSETVENGGVLTVANANTANDTTVLGGTFNISGADAGVNNTVLSGGGTLVMESAKATINGSLTFSGGGNTVEVTALTTTSAGSWGDRAVISGFSATDKIDVTAINTASASLSFASSGGNEAVTINGTSGTSGTSVSETFLFSGTTTYDNYTLSLAPDGTGGVELAYNPNGTTLTISSGTSSGLTVSGGYTDIVQSGGAVVSAIVENGGFLTISGGADTSATISVGGTETILGAGTATGDQIYGSAIVNGAGTTVTNETVESGGTLAISGGGTASNIVLSGGGTVELETPTDTLAGSLTFSGGNNTLDIASIASSGDGEQAVISGLSTTDQIVISGVGTNATLSFSTSGGNEIVTVSGGNGAETLVFSGTSTYTSSSLSLVSSGNAVDLEYSSTTSVTASTAMGAYTEAARNTLLVLSGGSVSAATIDNGGSLVVNGGADYTAAVLAAATETVSAGSAAGDQIYGSATVDTGANVASETVQDGGTLVVNGGAVDSASTIIAGGSETVLGSATGDQIYGTQLVSGATAGVTGETVEDGGSLAIGSGATASNIALGGGATVELESSTATLSGSLTFSDGHNTLDIASIASGGNGEQAVISGFSSTDQIVISGVGANATLSFATSGGNEVVTISGGSGTETLTFAGTSSYTSNTLSLVTSGTTVDLETSFATSDLTIQAYNASEASTVVAGPLALYAVPVDEIAPTQMNEGFTEVDAKAAAFDLFTTSTALEADLIGDIEPVVIGPNGQLYLLDGHHTFTALLDSTWGASNPTVYVNVIANYSADTEAQFIAQMQANNWLLPLNDGVPQTVDPATGSPIPPSLTGLTSNVYRGLEYSILKQKDSKLFTSSSNISGTTGAKTPGLDKMPGLYSDFAEAAAYQDADGGLGLPYLSPGDIAIATQWNLNPDSTTSLPNVSGTVFAYQLPGFILSQNVVIAASVSNATLGQTVSGGVVDPGSMEGAIDGNGTFTGITQINAGTAEDPVYIDTPNIGLIMQVGADKGFNVTLSNTDNTYIGGTTFLAGTLVIAGDGSLGAAPTESNAAFDSSLTFDGEGVPDNVTAAVQADNGIIFNSLREGNGTLTIGTTAGVIYQREPVHDQPGDRCRQ